MASAPELVGHLDQLVHHEVGLGGGVAAQGVGLVGEPDVQGVAVRIRVDRHGGDAFIAGGADDAHGDFAAVGDQHLAQPDGSLRRCLRWLIAARDLRTAPNLLTRRLLLSFREPSAVLRVPPILLADSARKAPNLCRVATKSCELAHSARSSAGSAAPAVHSSVMPTCAWPSSPRRVEMDSPTTACGSPSTLRMKAPP